MISCGKNYFFKVPRNKTVRNGFESISYLGPKFREKILKEIQEYDARLGSKSFSDFGCLLTFLKSVLLPLINSSNMLLKSI